MSLIPEHDFQLTRPRHNGQFVQDVSREGLFVGGRITSTPPPLNQPSDNDGAIFTNFDREPTPFNPDGTLRGGKPSYFYQLYQPWRIAVGEETALVYASTVEADPIDPETNDFSNNPLGWEWARWEMWSVSADATPSMLWSVRHGLADAEYAQPYTFDQHWLPKSMHVDRLGRAFVGGWLEGEGGTLVFQRLDESGGDVLWTYELGTVSITPGVRWIEEHPTDDRLIVIGGRWGRPGATYNLAGFDAETGDVLWETETGCPFVNHFTFDVAGYLVGVGHRTA